MPTSKNVSYSGVSFRYGGRACPHWSVTPIGLVARCEGGSLITFCWRIEQCDEPGVSHRARLSIRSMCGLTWCIGSVVLQRFDPVEGTTSVSVTPLYQEVSRIFIVDEFLSGRLC